MGSNVPPLLCKKFSILIFFKKIPEQAESSLVVANFFLSYLIFSIHYYKIKIFDRRNSYKLHNKTVISNFKLFQNFQSPNGKSDKLSFQCLFLPPWEPQIGAKSRISDTPRYIKGLSFCIYIGYGGSI